MMVPPPCGRMRSTAAHEASTVPRRSTARTRSSFCNRESSACLAGQDVGTGVVDPDIHPTERLPQMAHESFDFVGPADVGAHDLDPASQRADLPGGGFRALPIFPVGNGQVGAGSGAPECDGAADST